MLRSGAWPLGPLRVVVIVTLSVWGLAALAAGPARAGIVFSWSAPVPINHGSSLTAISCPSVTLCVALDTAGDLVTSTNPTGGSGAWVTFPGLVDDFGLGSVSCPTATLCVATDSLTGEVLTSTDPTGGVGAWQGATVDNGDVLNGVNCPDASLCVAVDANGDTGDVLTSSDPTGGAAAWSAAANIDSSGGLDQVSCTVSRLCIAVGTGLSTSTNPTGGAGAWTTTTALSASAVDCPTGHLCVAVDSDGGGLASSNPTGGPAAWKASPNIDKFHPFQPTTGVSCPASNQCVAVGLSGDALTTTNPLTTGGGWNAKIIDPNGGGLNDVSCPTVSLCVAVDATGNAVIGVAQGVAPLTATITTARARLRHNVVNVGLGCSGGAPGAAAAAC